MKRHFRIWLVFLSASVSAGSASLVRAQDNVWTRIGHEAASIRVLAVDPWTPSTIYAGTYGSGVFKSVDGGGGWTSIGNGLASDITSLVIDPITPTILYAGTYGGGVFKSIDGGESWSVINTGLTDTSISALALDPTTPSTLYVGTTDCDSVFSCSGTVFKSTNGGESWSPANTGLPTHGVSALAIDPTTPNTLYVGIINFGFFYDDDDGDHSAVFRSVDGGKSWVGTNLWQSLIQVIVIDHSTPTTLYGGTLRSLFKSPNSGETWSEISNNLPNLASLAIDPLLPTTLYAGTARGVLRSLDGGNSWNAINEGLTDNDPIIFVHDLAISQTAPATVYAGTPKGVFALQPVRPFPPPLRRITGASIIGKKLVVFGDNFDNDAVILVDGEPQRTRKDGQGLTDNLIGKKAGKNIAPGQTVRLQVRNSDGTLSPVFTFTRAVE